MSGHTLGSVSATHRIEAPNSKIPFSAHYAIELTSGSEEDAILVATSLVELTGEGWQVVRSKVVTEEKTVFTGGAPYVSASPPPSPDRKDGEPMTGSGSMNVQAGEDTDAKEWVPPLVDARWLGADTPFALTSVLQTVQDVIKENWSSYPHASYLARLVVEELQKKGYLK